MNSNPLAWMHRVAAWARMLVLLSAVAWDVAAAATPPATLSYQGVLRNGSNVALSGAFDMVFSFCDAPVAGNVILVDAHQAAASKAIVVTGGLFDTELGGGVVSDGGGAGVYTSLAQVFRDFGDVWMEIQIGAEVLSPRVRVEASAYALNASNLDGRPASSFLDTSSASQAKLGPLAVSVAAPGAYAVVAGADAGGGAFYDLSGTGIAYLGSGDIGLQAQGLTAGRFDQSAGYSSALLAWGDTGINASGVTAGGVFSEQAGTGSATLASSNIGVQGIGSTAGARFLTTSGSGSALIGAGNDGIQASGSNSGGYFTETDSPAWAKLANAGYGIQAWGPTGGGVFYEPNSASQGVLASFGRGVTGIGSFAGGSFNAYQQTGAALVGYGNTGIEASGSEAAGYFYNLDGTEWARLAWGQAGIQAQGSVAGGTFRSDASGIAVVGYGDFGIQAGGDYTGGHFYDADQSGYAYIAFGDRGIWAKGNFAGGTFSSPNDITYWADVATPTRKIVGTGTVSFVQNHPLEKDRTITYAAPEGDEVAVYTRGTARLVNGEARVRLGETFAFVANPDIGLTAHLTPRGEAVPLAVASLSTEEMVVKGSAGSKGEVVFDYLVWGLRVGFEDLPVVQTKTREAFLPASESVLAEYGEAADLGRFSARARHARMRVEAGLPEAAGLSRAPALVAAINEGRDAALAEADRRADEERATLTAGRPHMAAPARTGVASPSPARQSSAQPPLAQPSPAPDPVAASPAGVSAPSPARGGDLSLYPVLAVTDPVQAGDVLVLDPAAPGSLRLSTAPHETTVAGCAAAGEEGLVLPDGQALVGVSGVVLCRADATYGAIHVGDLLTTSPTPAHAMKAAEGAAGAILGKAMEPLEEGSGLVRVLIGLR